MKTFLCEYPFAGERWGFEIKADNEKEAQARLKALGWAELKGELMGKIPGSTPVWFIRLAVWLANKIV